MLSLRPLLCKGSVTTPARNTPCAIPVACFCLAQQQWHPKPDRINNTVSWIKDYSSFQKSRKKKDFLKTSWSIKLNLFYLLFSPLAFSLNHWPIGDIRKNSSPRVVKHWKGLPRAPQWHWLEVITPEGISKTCRCGAYGHA